MSRANLLRLGGFSAMLGGVLLVIAYLIDVFVNLFFVGPDEFGGGATTALLHVQTILALGGGVMVALGLVGLYLYQSEATGVPGFIGFLMAFAGTFLASGIIWAALLAHLGWALFGASSLRAQAYPRAAATLLVVGALVSGAASALVGVPGSILMDLGAGSEALFSAVMYVGSGAEIVLYASIARLGLLLYTKRSQAVQQPEQAG